MLRSRAAGPPTASYCIAQGHMLLFCLRGWLTGVLFPHRRATASSNLIPVQLIQLEECFTTTATTHQYVSAHRRDLMSVIKLNISKLHVDFFNETSMLISCSISVLFFSFSNVCWSSPPSLSGERSSYHQSAFSSCGLRQCHAELCVLPDRTTVPSGYPYTSSLTPLIFTCYREN